MKSKLKLNIVHPYTFLLLYESARWAIAYHDYGYDSWLNEIFVTVSIMYKSTAARIRNNGKPIVDYQFTKNWLPPQRQYPGEFGLSVRWSKQHCFTLGSVKWTENAQVQENILAVKHLQRWAERKDTLWWSCLAHMDLGKRTVRSYSARRVRQAFVESLRKQGYASDGSPLPDTQKRPLVGTVMLGAKAPTLKLKMDALKERTDLVVEMLLKSQSWSWSSGNQKTGKPFEIRRPRGSKQWKKTGESEE